MTAASADIQNAEAVAPVMHEQEFEPTGVPTGRIAMWWFLAGEVCIFGGLIATYVLMRLRHPEWADYAASTMWQIGAINTVVLLTSSLTIVQAFQRIDEGKLKEAINRILITMGLACLFLGIKAFEYSHEIGAGFVPTTNLFWSYYFAMTGLHAVHVIAGIFVMGLVVLWVRKGKHLTRVEYVGLYWHIVDIVWIFLFPLLYIAS